MVAPAEGVGGHGGGTAGISHATGLRSGRGPGGTPRRAEESASQRKVSGHLGGLCILPHRIGSEGRTV
jgi:hypothetical protein